MPATRTDLVSSKRNIMKAKLETTEYEDDSRKVKLHYRPGTSDEGCIKEVIERRCYARRRAGFDVMPGERWLDLGANIGAFAAYAVLRGAVEVDCYEPEPECFEILTKNAAALSKYAKVNLHNVAITNRKEPRLAFKKGRSPTDHYRATIMTENRLPELGALENRHGAFLKKLRYDGVKMDIEGSEFGLIDDDLLPRAGKLVMEYHYGRDRKNLTNLAERLARLERRFTSVWVPGFVQRDLDAGVEEYSGMFDSMIFCSGGVK
jgi:FkbM family methyltransferase